MDYQFFRVHIDQHIAEVAIHRPDKANALHQAAWDELEQIFRWLDTHEAARVIILRGEGKHFCAGIDLELLMSIQQFRAIDCDGRLREKLRRFILRLQAPINAIERCSKPVLAATHHGCIGGGLDIIAACDMRYCSADAYFTIKEIDLGMVADLGTLLRLPKLLSPALVAEMAYTGRQVAGADAEKIGLVNRCYPDQEQLLTGVRELAAQIATKSPLSIRGIKANLRYARDHRVDDALDYMSLWNAALFISKDLEEAFMAAMEKRQAVYRD